MAVRSWSPCQPEASTVPEASTRNTFPLPVRYLSATDTGSGSAAVNE